MSEEQLERSILERKASDELRAIATAMSLEPVGRLRKADLVNQILRAAGVEVEGATASPTKGAPSLQSPPANGGTTATSPEDKAESDSASKPARGRTSRARATVKTRRGRSGAGPQRGERKWWRATPWAERWQWRRPAAGARQRE